MRLRLLSADDIFISYSRKDAATYALGLAEALTKAGFTCFLDRLGTEAAEDNRELPPSLLKKLRRCSMLVVIGTEGATDSRAIEQEISEFSRANGTSKIVPIDFGGAAQGAPWQSWLVGIAAESETVEALSHGNPSKQVVTRIEKSFDYARSKQRLRRYTYLAATLLTVSFITAGASYLYAQEQLAQAQAATEAAEAARKEAERERETAGVAKRAAAEQASLAKQAEGERIEAEGKAAEAAGRATEAEGIASEAARRAAEAEGIATEAEGKAAEAEGRAKQAEGKRVEAEDKAVEAARRATEAEGKADNALRQQQVAEAREREATENATRQEKMGESRRLASQAARSFDDDLDFGLLLTTSALGFYDTYEARDRLLNALQRRPRLLSYLWVETPGGDAYLPLDLVLGANDEIFAVESRSGVTVRVVASGEKIFDSGAVPRNGPSDFALSADGKLLALSTSEKLSLWDLKIGRELTVVRNPCGYVATRLTFDPTGKYLAFDCAGTVYVSVADRADKPVELPGQRLKIHPESMAFSPDGKMLAAAGEALMVWNMDKLSAQRGWPPKVGEDEAMEREYDQVTFSPDGKVLITTSNSRKKLITWDVATRKKTGQYDGEQFSSLTFNHKGDLLAVGGNRAIRLLATATMKEVESLSVGRSGNFKRLIFTKDDGKLISVGNEALVWDMNDDQHLGRVLDRSHKRIRDIAFSPDGKYLASCGNVDGDRVVLRDVRRGEPVAPPLWEAIGSASSLSFSRDSKVLAMVTRRHTAEVVELWDVERGRLISTPYTPSKSRVGKMALSPDGGLLAVGFYELTFRDAAGGRQRGPALDLPGSEYINRLTFSPDGSLLAVGTSKANILLIDTRTLRQTGRISFAEHGYGKGYVEALAFSPDGSTLASNGFARGRVILWDVASRSPLRILNHPDASAFVYAVVFSADGKMLAMADGHHFIRTGRSGTFSVNKQQESSIYLWDTETQQPLGPPLKGHTAPITSLAFGPRCAGCPAETSLVSGDARGTLMMWDMSVASWQRRACAISNRRLTDRERASYLKDMSPHEVCPASPSFSALTLPPAAAERTPLSRLVKLPPYPMSLLEHLNDESSDSEARVVARLRRTYYLELSPAGRDRDGGGEKETTETKLERIVADKLDERPSSLHFGFKLTEEDGIGAAEKAALLKTVGKEFGFDIPAQDGEKIETFPDLLAYVQRRIDAGNKPK